MVSWNCRTSSAAAIKSVCSLCDRSKILLIVAANGVSSCEVLEARAGGVAMSSGLVLSFLRRSSGPSDWNQQELAEFYRVESALLQGGLSVTTDRGISDEGDPWFVFCRADDERADDEEVIAHFARIDREYLIVSNLHSGVARGSDFRRLICQMIELHPLLLAIKRNQNQKIFLHPAALLAAMLASAYFLSNEKDSTSGIARWFLRLRALDRRAVRGAANRVRCGRASPQSRLSYGHAEGRASHAHLLGEGDGRPCLLRAGGRRRPIFSPLA